MCSLHFPAPYTNCLLFCRTTSPQKKNHFTFHSAARDNHILLTHSPGSHGELRSVWSVSSGGEGSAYLAAEWGGPLWQVAMPPRAGRTTSTQPGWETPTQLPKWENILKNRHPQADRSLSCWPVTELDIGNHDSKSQNLLPNTCICLIETSVALIIYQVVGKSCRQLLTCLVFIKPHQIECMTTLILQKGQREAQRGQILFPRSHGYYTVKSGFEASRLGRNIQL